jgi:shikimate kinase
VELERPIFLIGYRGSGKSSVARELARRLNSESIDTDDEIERRAGKSIAAIFMDQGEAAFRDLEAAVVAECGRLKGVVVALGGGAVLRDENVRVIMNTRTAVWLKATADTIEKRLAADATTASRRPDLTTAGGRAEIESLLAERTPLYRQCANLEIDTEGKTPAEVAAEITAFVLAH